MPLPALHHVGARRGKWGDPRNSQLSGSVAHGGLGLCMQVAQEAAEGWLPRRELEMQAALLFLQLIQSVS